MQTNEFGFFKKGFLLLKRKAGQSLKIGTDIKIEVAKVENGIVYLAVKAPNMKVLRTELEARQPRAPEVTSAV